MPELPEVETVARDLKPLLTGKTIQGAWWSGKKLRLPWQEVWTSYVRGWAFQDVKRRANWLVFY
ncbi:MAG: DNA-formamidopyrimidine glycosylase family protein, partial [Gemmataceae bacterium]